MGIFRGQFGRREINGTIVISNILLLVKKVSGSQSRLRRNCQKDKRNNQETVLP